MLEDENISVSLSQGLRPYMEDTYIVDKITKRQGKDIKILAVFDGHGGDSVSNMLKDEFIPHLKKLLLRSPEINICLRKAFLDLDNQSKPIGFSTGSTAVVIVMKENELYIANCGDSEAMMGYKNKNIKILSERHKVEDEKSRLVSLGAEITYDDPCARINHTLNLARSIGDHYLKQFVISTPYIRLIKINKNVEYIIIASDGLWDVYDYKTLQNEIQELKHRFESEGKNKTEITDAIGFELVKRALLRGSTDNITIILHFLE